MSAGEYVQIKNEDPHAPVPMNIYIRQSKLKNVDGREIFRIVTEGMKFYEHYTGKAYPWTKFDQII